MSKTYQIAEHVIVTFVEAALAYVAINQTSLSGAGKWLSIGALGAGLSAVYNLLRQSQPTMPPVTPPSAQVVSPATSQPSEVVVPPSTT